MVAIISLKTRRVKSMYYTINAETDKIIDQGPNCPDPQKEADYFGCPVYIIEGQHIGLTATPERGAAPMLERGSIRLAKDLEDAT